MGFMILPRHDSVIPVFLQVTPRGKIRGMPFKVPQFLRASDCCSVNGHSKSVGQHSGAGPQSAAVTGIADAVRYILSSCSLKSTKSRGTLVIERLRPLGVASVQCRRLVKINGSPDASPQVNQTF